MIPAIFGLSGPALTDGERSLFHACDPAGFILFARNIETPGQVAALTASLRDVLGREVAILIDQEGGRIARLRPPHWPEFPAAQAFAPLYELAPMSALEACRQNGRALAALLRAVGINVDCLPVLDVPQPDGHAIIGDRAYGTDPIRVAAMGGATLGGLREGGVEGVIKHLPGHGRARADSHLELPVVDASREALAQTDFAAFASLARKARTGMTAHVVYAAYDAARCASLSPTIISDVIRGEIGFDGLLMSDDLGMKALTGTMAERAVGVIAAGCDLALDCWGNLAEMEAAAAVLPPITEAAAARLARALEGLDVPAPDYAKAAAHRDALLALAPTPA